MMNNLQKEITGNGMKTGLIDIDNITGIFQPAEYIILAGRPSMGKTAFCLCTARHLAENNYPVLIFSIETTKEVMCGRIVFGATECSYDKILRGNQLEISRHTASTELWKMSEAPIYIDDTPGATIGHIEAIAENYVKNHGVKIIMIDHVGLIKGSQERSRHEELSNISKGIKTTLKKLNVPGIILCQLSRKVEERHPPIPMLSDLRESGSLEDDADKVIFIYREEYYKRYTKEEIENGKTKKGIAEIILAKNKNGRTGYNEVAFDLETMNFRDLSNQKTEARTDW
jgi:replicative DNA helicase